MNQLSGCFGRVIQVVKAVDDSVAATIDLSELGIDDKCLASLHDWLHKQKQMVSLDLSTNKITDEGLINLLLELDGHALKSLNLKKNKLTDVSMSALAGYLVSHASLVNIDLSNNLLMDRGVCILGQSLTGRARLNRVVMKDVGMSTPGARCLLSQINHSTLPSSLDLSFNKLAGFTILNMPSRNDRGLQSLSLASCDLDDEASQSLADFLPHLQGLNHLNLSDNNLSNRAVSLLAQAVVGHDHLMSWNMHFSVLTDEAELTLVRLSEHRPMMDIQY